jgi:hypothetical protein
MRLEEKATLAVRRIAAVLNLKFMLKIRTQNLAAGQSKFW